MNRLLVILLLVAACGGAPTSPPIVHQGHDPIAVVRNGSADPVLWWWFDGQSVTGMDTIPAGATHCEQFFARPDSARYDLADSVRIKAAASGWSEYTSNWFDPVARPTWAITIGAQAIIAKDTTDVPCS